jgi:hypothetical protein
MRWHSLAAGVVLVMLPRSNLGAELPASPQPPATPEPTAFDRPFAISGYLLGWAGSYDAAGVGGRLRWEILPHRLGMDLFGEALIVNWPGAFRHDHPVGFNVYVPFDLGSRVRLRPLFGMCAVFSFVDPPGLAGPSTADVLFGIHAGVGIEVIVVGSLTWFLDAQAFWYLGHNPLPGWGGLENSLSSTWLFQPSTGLQFHFGATR